MRRLAASIIILFISGCLLYSGNYVPPCDTIVLSVEHVEGRWVESRANNPDNIYLFRGDSTFFKAVDNSGLLLFNVSGWYTLSGDTVRVVYQDMSGNKLTRAKPKIMLFKVIALSDEELNIDKTEDGVTSFMRLRRQSVK